MLLPNKNLTERAEKKIRAGEDFDGVAADLAASGVENSSLGNISEENMNSKIHNAIRGLKVGEVSKPLATGSGYMMLKIVEISAPKDASFEREKEKLRGELYQKALLSQLKLWTERERASSYIHLSAP